MKKNTFAALLMGLTLMVGVILAPMHHAYAQEAEVPVYTTRAELIAAINVLRAELIALLTQQIAFLQTQLDQEKTRTSSLEARQSTVEQDYAKKTDIPAPGPQINPGAPASKVLKLQLDQKRSYEQDGAFFTEVRLKADDAEAFIVGFDGAYDTLTTNTPKLGETYKIGEDVTSVFTLSGMQPLTITGVRYSTTATGEVQTLSL